MAWLPFLDRAYSNGPIRDYWDLDAHQVRERPGVYVLNAPQGFQFKYPRCSSVFYIG